MHHGAHDDDNDTEIADGMIRDNAHAGLGHATLMRLVREARELVTGGNLDR
jgi:hypothetical protein